MSRDYSASGFQGNVIIIGGGIGGSALALFLKQAGIRSHIYEAYPYQEGIGAGIGLAPNGMNVLAALSLADAIKARGTIITENYFYNAQGSTLAHFTAGSAAKYGQPAMSVLRPALQDVLTDEAKKQGIPISYEKRLTDITTRGEKVTAHFEDGTSAEADLLIGADGINSMTRRLILPDAPKPQFTGVIGVGGIAPLSAVPMLTETERSSFNFTYGTTGFFGYAGIGTYGVQWWANLHRDTELPREQLINPSIDEVKADMLALFTGYHAPIEALIHNMHAPIRHNISDIQSLPEWYRGRVVLIGDAAHAVSPNSGQGASMALEDAMILARLLCHSGNIPHVFAEFQSQRKPRVERIVAEGRARGKDKQTVTPFQAAFRDVMMRIMIPIFGPMGQDWLYGYNIEW